VITPTPPAPEPTSTVEVKALLEAANQASAQVSVLHITFMAVCTYVLVIVFSTTDLDLLIGKGIKLPVVDVEVPIVGFYGSAPLLIVLVHFNLLLQLQLLSRKLYAYDAVASTVRIHSGRSAIIAPSGPCPVSDERDMGGGRDMLHIFPYTYYLVGRTGPLVRRCLGVVVGITILLLPLVTLLLLQLRFLAYQEPSITWVQRIGVWADVAMVVALWPIIMDRNDNWLNYLRELRNQVRQQKRMAVFWVTLWVAVVAVLFTNSLKLYLQAFMVANVIAVLGVRLKGLGVFTKALAPLMRRWYPRRLASRDVRRHSALVKVQGMPGFLLVLALGLPMPLALVAKGELLERDLIGKSLFNLYLNNSRNLKLSGEVLLAKPVPPEIVAQLREGISGKVKEALAKVEPIKLQRRGLRGAQLNSAVLSGADLWDAHLEGADLRHAHLEGANFQPPLPVADFWDADQEDTNLRVLLVNADLRVHLEGANLGGAHLEGADLRDVSWGEGADLPGAHLEGANLGDAHLEGADLRGAHLEGANLGDAHLEGADLRDAHLEGTDFGNAHLEGTNLGGAHLEGANLRGAHLEGADLRNARLYAASLTDSITSLVDVRGAKWSPLARQELEQVQSFIAGIPDKNHHSIVLKRIEQSIRPALPSPHFHSCLIDAETALIFGCKKQWLPEEVSFFQKKLYTELEKLVCNSTPTARSLIFNRDEAGARLGFRKHMKALLDSSQCRGLQNLRVSEKDALRRE